MIKWPKHQVELHITMHCQACDDNFHFKRPCINQGSNRSSFAEDLSSGSQHNIRRRKCRKSSFSSPVSLPSRVSRLYSGMKAAPFQLPDGRLIIVNVVKY